VKPAHSNHLPKMVEKFEQECGHKWEIKKCIKINPTHQHNDDDGINLQKRGMKAKPRRMDEYIN
jgi:hypothetical protein